MKLYKINLPALLFCVSLFFSSCENESFQEDLSAIENSNEKSGSNCFDTSLTRFNIALFLENGRGEQKIFPVETESNPVSRRNGLAFGEKILNPGVRPGAPSQTRFPEFFKSGIRRYGILSRRPAQKETFIGVFLAEKVPLQCSGDFCFGGFATDETTPAIKVNKGQKIRVIRTVPRNQRDAVAGAIFNVSLCGNKVTSSL